MKCPNCHSKIDDDSKFCPHCGKEIITELVCPQCGQVNSPDASFCKKCGCKLQEVEEESAVVAKPEKKSKKIKTTNNLNNIFSIVAMGSMIVSFALILGLVFAPYLHDNFFPDSMFTIIGFAQNVLSEDFNRLLASYEYAAIVNTILGLFLLVLTASVSLAFLIICVPRFVSALKNKEYSDLSKGVVFAYILFLFTVIFNANSSFNQELNYINTYAGGVIFGIIIIPVFLVFNIFTKEYLEESHNILHIVLRSVVRVLVFTFVFIVIFGLDSNHFYFIASIVHKTSGSGYDYTTTTTMNANNVAFINYFVTTAPELNIKVKDALTKSLTLAGVSLVLESVSLVLLLFSLFKPLSSDIRKPGGYIAGMVLSLVSLVMLSVSLGLNDSASSAINQINSTVTYDAVIKSTTITDRSVTSIVLTSLAMITFGGAFALEKTVLERSGK